jgi:hypothetical protein
MLVSVSTRIVYVKGMLRGLGGSGCQHRGERCNGDQHNDDPQRGAE